jgi:competence protein ComEA
MPTSQERQALLFLALIAGLGAGARAADQSRLARQLAAAEPQATGPGAVTGPDEALARQQRAVDSARAAVAARRAARPARASGGGRPPRTGTGGVAAPTPAAPIDVDVATAGELERLPRIGPALAARIVATRDSLGGFGSLEALRHVRGIGPSTAALLEPLVTFSGRHRPSRGAQPRPWPTPRSPDR